MLIIIRSVSILLLGLLLFSAASHGESAVTASDRCMSDDWISKGDQAFAADCADMAFEGGLDERQTVAWMFFTRVNQLIDDKPGFSGRGKVPQWMAWATDDDTFQVNPTFAFKPESRDDVAPVTNKKVLAGTVFTAGPNGANEESIRNPISFDYITKAAKLNTYEGVMAYVQEKPVDMPVGSIELKASWLQIDSVDDAPEGALTFQFDSGLFWWRGIHIMAKMRPIPADASVFYSEDPSWFWTTFEFDNNTGVQHVRETLISQRSPLSVDAKSEILDQGGILGFGFMAYSPNGTQIRFTENGDGKTPIVLGHTDMEDFAGCPDNSQPEGWTEFKASCHTCHSTAAINPETGEYFPFTVAVGTLEPSYQGIQGDVCTTTQPPAGAPKLGDGFVSLDFMWPIPFHAPKPDLVQTPK